MKEDNSSWRAGSIHRRDFRAARTDPEAGRHRSRKNTGKWCKGKVGLSHHGRWQEWDYSWMRCWDSPPVMISVCTFCGKRLDWVSPPDDVRKAWRS